MFMNTLPVRVRTGEPGVLDAVIGMRAQLARLLEHEHAPLVLAQRASALPPDVPLFTTLFNYRHNTAAGPAGTDDAGDGGFEGIRQLFSRERTNYPLVVLVDDNGSAGFGLVVDAVGPIDPQAVAAMLHTATGGLVTALEDSLDGGRQAPLSALGVLDAAERDRLVAGVERHRGAGAGADGAGDVRRAGGAGRRMWWRWRPGRGS